MRFIRDIIDEKKRNGGFVGAQMAEATTRTVEAARAPYVLEDRHAVSQDEALEKLGDDLGACQGEGFDEDEAFELLAEYGSEEDGLICADSLFAPDGPTPEIEAPAEMAPAEVVPEMGPPATSSPIVEPPAMRAPDTETRATRPPTMEPTATRAPEMAAPRPPADPVPRMPEAIMPEAPHRGEQDTGEQVPADTPFGAFDATDQILARRPSRAAADPVQVPAPAEGRTSRRAARVKTRLLGFSPAHGDIADPLAGGAAGGGAASRFPVGWLTVTGGRGRGTGFTLHSGVSNIGRGEDQTVRLDFGDNSISRSGHAIVAYDPEQRKFFLGHGGKANLVRLNDRPVLSTELMQSGDLIRIGETTLRFTALCGGDFDWSDDTTGSCGQSDGFDHAAAG